MELEEAETQGLKRFWVLKRNFTLHRFFDLLENRFDALLRGNDSAFFRVPGRFGEETGANPFVEFVGL